MGSPAIAVSLISKRFKLYSSPKERFKDLVFTGWGVSHEYIALKNVSFQIKKGEIVGLIGANGAGKSTLLQILCKTLQASDGSLTVNGRVSALLELGAGFNPEYTGIENVKFYFALHGIVGKRMQDLLPQVIAFADIGEYIHQPLKTYSSGMYVRLAFAAAIHIEPDILIVDEALAVGDVNFQAKCLDRIERLMQSGATVLLVTHDIQMVKQFCDRVLYLRKGELVYDGPAEEGTEIYLSEAIEKSVNGEAVTKSTHVGAKSKMAFGSMHGRIVNAMLSVDEKSGNSLLVRPGQRVNVEIDVWVSAEVKAPRVQLTIRDRRGLNLFGFNNRYADVDLNRNENGDIRVRFSFDANLQLGDYAITIRLDECDSVENKLIDKQVGILDFTITSASKKFDAIIDLNGDCEVIT